MGRRKAIPRQTLPMSSEEEAFFSTALNEKLEYNPGNTNKGVDTDLKAFLDSKYLEWSGHFLNALKEDAFRGPLNALRQLRQYDVHIGFTVRGVFDHVWMGHDMDELLEETAAAYDSREKSQNRLETIIAKTSELEAMSTDEPAVANFCGQREDPFAHPKKALFSFVDDALGALREIYAYEMTQYDPDPLRKDLQRVLANQVNSLLPPEIHFAGKRWWDELAELMAGAKVVLINRMKQAPNRGRGYSAQSIRNISRDYSDEDIQWLRDRFRANMPDFFERLQTEPADQVLTSLKRGASFSPSLKSKTTIELAMALLDQILLR